MNICFIGKHKYPKDIFSNEQDMKTWRSMAECFEQLFVIAESPNFWFYYGKEKNVSVYLLPRLGYFGFIKQATCLGFYLNWRYGVDAFDASEVVGGGIAITLLKFFTDKPTIIEVQGEIFRKAKDKENFKSRLLKKIGSWTMRNAARIRVISRAIFNQVANQGVPSEKIRLVSLRIDLNLFNPYLLIHRIYKSGDKMGITIGYLGRLADGKGLEDLLIAIANLKSKFQILNFRVLIFGQGPLEPKLKKMSKDLKIDNKIEWREFVSYSKVPEALNQIDIFVYPSWHEGFGRSIMEALAMEKAVVATRVGGIPDLINNRENGFLVKPHNPGKLAEKIKELMQNKSLREKFGKAGRAWVTKNFEWNDGIKKFADVFLELR